MKPKVIAVVGAKGGTAKTSTVAALGHVLAEAGCDTLLLDVDPQGGLTRRFGLPRVEEPLLAGPVPLELGTKLRGRLRLLRGGRSLEAATEEAIAGHLTKAMVTGADVLIIDTPPALGPIVRAVFAQSDLVLTPCTPGIESVDGFADMSAAAGHAGRRIRALIVLGRRGTKILRWTRDAFAERMPGALLEDIEIPHEVAASESAVHNLPVTATAPESRSAAAYRRLAAVIGTQVGLEATS